MSGAFVKVCPVDSVPMSEGRSIGIVGRRVAIFRTESGAFAVDSACPQDGGPLQDGIVSDSRVTCPIKGCQIDLTAGELVGPSPKRINTYPVKEMEGWFYVSVATHDTHI